MSLKGFSESSMLYTEHMIRKRSLNRIKSSNQLLGLRRRSKNLVQIPIAHVKQVQSGLAQSSLYLRFESGNLLVILIALQLGQRPTPTLDLGFILNIGRTMRMRLLVQIGRLLRIINDLRTRLDPVTHRMRLII